VDRPLVALGRKLEKCPKITTLGIRDDFSCYSPEELDLIRRARLVFYPGKRFIDPLCAAGKETFPTEPAYRLATDRIKQSALFRLLGLPTPRTWILFGKKQKAIDPAELPLPLVAKPARRGALGKGVRLVSTEEELKEILAARGVTCLQEYVPHTADLRVALINCEVVHHYFREPPEGDFRSAHPAGKIRLGPAPGEVLDLARSLARAARLNPVCVDFMEGPSGWLVLDIGLMFGLRGFAAAGLNPYGIICKMVERGQL
jgi:ribosomal protein S6--L-glutamate ligase